MPILSWLLLTAALFLVFLASWIVLPAPNLPLLVLGVAAPELSAWLASGGFVLCAVRLGVGPLGTWVSRATVALAVLAMLVSLMPLVQVPFAVRRFDRALQASLGEDLLRGVPADHRARMRPAPFVALDLVRGIDAGNARVSRDVLFAAPEGTRLTLDIYRPATTGRYPSVVQIYGGAWQRGSPGDDRWFATYLAARGYVVFAIDYRHAPRWRWPAQIEDVRAALAWIRQHGTEYDADPTRLALLGRSAGAQLAMVAAYEPGAAAVRAVVSYYGPVDLEDGYRHPPVPDPLDVRSVEKAFLGGTPDEAPVRYRDASPITYASRPLPPSLLIYGGRDHIVLSRFGALLDNRLRAAGSRSVFLEIPWAEHAFDVVRNGPSGQLSLYYTERFLAWALMQTSSG